MVRIDRERVRRSVQLQFAVDVVAEYGEAGARLLPELALALDRVHEQLAFELIREGLTVLIAIDPDARLLPSERSVEVPEDELPTVVRGQATIQVVGADRVLVLPEATDPTTYSDLALVYHFADADYFVVGGQLTPVL